MVRGRCNYISRGLNYIVWEYSKELQGVFIIHVGGNSKRELYKLFKDLQETEEDFSEGNIYFCSQQDTYWRNHSELYGFDTLHGNPVYKYKK